MSTKSDNSFVVWDDFSEPPPSESRKRCIRISILILVIFVVCFSTVLLLAAYFFGRDKETPEQIIEVPWYEKGVIYQLDPRTFSSANGKLVDVIQHLDYIKKLGASAVLLTPLSTVSAKDWHISDNLTDIDPSLGTIDEFENLVREVHKKGLEVVLDLVLSHTSNKHPWFVDSVYENGTSDYYVWANGTATDPSNPPNLWQQVNDAQSAWKYNEERGQFYLHWFDSDMPVLNYKNDSVREYAKEVLNFWLDKGVVGFRILGANMLFTAPLDKSESYFEREDLELLREWRELLAQRTEHDDKPRLLAIELDSAHSAQPYIFYGDEVERAADFPVNYNLTIPDSGYAMELAVRNQAWSKSSWTIPNWAINKPWKDRTNLEVKRVEALNMMTVLLSGVTFTLAGDELCLDDPDPLKPLPWEEDGSVQPGTGCLDSYENVLNIRRNSSVPRTSISFSYPETTTGLFTFIRHEESGRYLFATNFETESKTLSLEGTGTVIARSLLSPNDILPEVGTVVDLSSITLNQYSATVIKLS